MATTRRTVGAARTREAPPRHARRRDGRDEAREGLFARHRHDLWTVAFATAAALLALACWVGALGIVGHGIDAVLARAIGWARFLVPIALLGAAVALLTRREPEPRRVLLGGGLVLLAAGLLAGAVAVAAKWLLVGRIRAGEFPLWSSFVWLNELADTFVETVAAPLFPRYLFVSVDMSVQRWRSIYSTVGVSRLVCNGDDPTPVPNGIVDGLKNREDANGLIKLDSRPPFRVGETIRVLDGAFSSCLGLFEGMAERERIAILLDLLGRKVRVVLDADLVAAA